MKNADTPVHPCEVNIEGHGPITKREMFAMAAMQAIIQVKGSDTYYLSQNAEDVCGDIAQASLRVADELLKQLES